MSNNSKVDALFISVADSTGGLEGLVESFFGFLARRTDFFDQPLNAKKLIDENFHLAQAKRQNLTRKTEPKIVEITDENIDAIPLPSEPSKAPLPPPEEPQEVLNKVASDEQAKEQAAGGSNKRTPNAGNGFDSETYSWTQTLSTLDISVPLNGKYKTRDVSVSIKTKHIKIELQGKVILDGDFHENIKADESIWSLVDGNVVQISCEKVNQSHWWLKLLESEDAELESSKIVPETGKLSDLDGDTRQAVEKMMLEQQMKCRPDNSQNLQKMALLEQFKKSHPEMDFSKAKISL